jgi:NADH dehydrogenase
MNLIPRVDFSLHKEVFFVTIGSLVGAFTMFLPRFLLDITFGTSYYITWFVFARVVGSDSLVVGVLLHLFVSTIIGIITGIILYKGKILNISKISNGFLYGIICGFVAFLIFFIPVYQWILAPNAVEVITALDPKMSILEANDVISQDYADTLRDAVISHIIWGLTLGLLASVLTNKFGARYRCHPCDIQFSKIATYEHHKRYVHESQSPTIKKILILGGGFAGINVLKKIQDTFEKNIDVQISLVSEDNFFLFTPMLPEISSGVIEPRHIATPIRTFCKRARFFEAEVTQIDLKGKNVTVSRPFDKKTRNLEYDYLVLALGGRTNFFGNKNLAKYALTIKTLGDAMSIRNHVITMLESADQEDDPHTKEKFLTFVIVGGGLSGIETACEINDFVKESAEHFYRNIELDKIKVILVSGTARILSELGDDLSEFATKSLGDGGIKIIRSLKVSDAGPDYVILEDGTKIETNTLVWAGGVAVDDIISKLECHHDKSGRLVVDEYLKIPEYPNVHALGDCAIILDPITKKPYPQTAQHAVREAKVVANNLISSIHDTSDYQTFSYISKGTMAKIGKRNGVALLFNHKIHGLFGWFVWRQYYLSNLPSNSKKFRVALDWAVDFFAKRDTTRLRNLKEK